MRRKRYLAAWIGYSLVLILLWHVVGNAILQTIKLVAASTTASVRRAGRAFQLLVLFLFLAATALVCTAGQVASSDQGILLEDFEKSPLQAFPSRWKVRGDEDAAQVIYRVAEENGNRFLHAYADRQAIQIGLVRVIQPREFPVLRWRWRVLQLPTGGNEARKETHDSAAGVYVIFDNTLFPRVIKYVWSTTVPAGTRLQNPLYWRAKMIVLRSDADGLGAWRQETVNFYRDYQELFGAEPGPVQGIGLMTSASFTQSVASADYDDFLLLPSETLPTEDARGTTAQRPPAALGGH